MYKKKRIKNRITYDYLHKTYELILSLIVCLYMCVIRRKKGMINKGNDNANEN